MQTTSWYAPGQAENLWNAARAVTAEEKLFYCPGGHLLFSADSRWRHGVEYRLYRCPGARYAWISRSRAL